MCLPKVLRFARLFPRTYDMVRNAAFSKNDGKEPRTHLFPERVLRSFLAGVLRRTFFLGGGGQKTKVSPGDTLLRHIFRSCSDERQPSASVSSAQDSAALCSLKGIPKGPIGCGSKPMVPFWGRCTTHFSLFEWGLGCPLGVRDFDPQPLKYQTD